MTEKLGSEFCSYNEAASRLNKHKRSIYNYVNDGRIRKKIENGEVVLYRSDVEQLAVDFGVDMPPLNRKTIFLLMSKLRQLEEKMAVVQTMLELDHKPLKLKPAECVSMHQMVTNLLAAPVLPNEVKETWSDLLYRIDEDTLTSISKAVEDPKPWLPYFQLCLRMAKECAEDPRIHTDPKLAGTSRRLDEALKKLRSVVTLWVEMNQGTHTEGVLQAVGSKKADLVRRLTSRTSNS